MRGDKTFGACDLKSTGDQKGLAASVLAPDKFCIAPSLRYVIQLFANDTFFNIETNSDPLKAACRNRAPPQRVDDVDTFKPAPAHLFRFRCIHRLLHPLQPLSFR